MQRFFKKRFHKLDSSKKHILITIRKRHILLAEFIILILVLHSLWNMNREIISIEILKYLNPNAKILQEEASSDDYIKWMEFNVPLAVLNQALIYDINSYQDETPLDWIQLLAYTAAKNWGTFKGNKNSTDMDSLVERLRNGEKMSDITKDINLYPYYLEIYQAVLNGFVGEYEVEETSLKPPYETNYIKKYGLKVFSPIAQGYYFYHYEDFGVSRSYGYKRTHMGNDLMGNVGTPIIAVEDGYVEALGWNQYGGWRIGIRSNDKKRYYYYAHLRKDHPFNTSLKEGSKVQAGDVIGYLGMTGYSTTENVNNIKTPHLHFGLQIIFDESQKDGTNQIWIDVYPLVELLSKNKMPVYKDEQTNEYQPSYKINTFPMD